VYYLSTDTQRYLFPALIQKEAPRVCRVAVEPWEFREYTFRCCFSFREAHCLATPLLLQLLLLFTGCDQLPFRGQQP
jgi:hypothetical protein